MPRGMRGSSLRRRVNFCQRFSSKKSLEGVQPAKYTLRNTGVDSPVAVERRGERCVGHVRLQAPKMKRKIDGGGSDHEVMQVRCLARESSCTLSTVGAAGD